MKCKFNVGDFIIVRYNHYDGDISKPFLEKIRKIDKTKELVFYTKQDSYDTIKTINEDAILACTIHRIFYGM